MRHVEEAASRRRHNNRNSRMMKRTIKVLGRMQVFFPLFSFYIYTNQFSRCFITRDPTQTPHPTSLMKSAVVTRPEIDAVPERDADASFGPV